MGKSQKIAKLFEKRQKIEKEIEELQRSCKHSTKSVKQVRERVDSSNLVIRYVCDECLMILGYPTQQDSENFFKE
jgi:uncharacterized coiled-coil DUF342 family protein